MIKISQNILQTQIIGMQANLKEERKVNKEEHRMIQEKLTGLQQLQNYRVEKYLKTQLKKQFMKLH